MKNGTEQSDLAAKLSKALAETLTELEQQENPKIAAINKLLAAAKKETAVGINVVLVLEAEKDDALKERRVEIGAALVEAFGATYGIALAGSKKARRAAGRKGAAVEVSDADKRKVLDSVGAKETGQKAIGKAAGLDTAVVSVALRALESEEKVVRVGAGRYPSYRKA